MWEYYGIYVRLWCCMWDQVVYVQEPIRPLIDRLTHIYSTDTLFPTRRSSDLYTPWPHIYTVELSHIYHYTLAHKLLGLTYNTITSHIYHYTLTHTPLYSHIYTIILLHIHHYTVAHKLHYSLTHTKIPSYMHHHTKVWQYMYICKRDK